MCVWVHHLWQLGTASSPSAMIAAMDCPSGVAIPNRLKWPIQWMWLGSGGNKVYWQLARVLILGRDFCSAMWIVYTINLFSKLYRFSCLSVEDAFHLYVLSIICAFHCCPPQDSAFYSFRCLVPLSIADFTSQSRQSPPTHSNLQIRRRWNTTHLSPTRGFIPPCHKQCHESTLLFLVSAERAPFQRQVKCVCWMHKARYSETN